MNLEKLGTVERAGWKGADDEEEKGKKEDGKKDGKSNGKKGSKGKKKEMTPAERRARSKQKVKVSGSYLERGK